MVAAAPAAEQTRQTLAATPETEYDDHGRIIGQGLTQRPTRHRFTLDPEDLSEFRASFCNQVHYFASPADARPWLGEHPDGDSRFVTPTGSPSS